MRDRIVARDTDHLKLLIKEEIILNGTECDLNHIDVSNIINFNSVFEKSRFNGDISMWDVSKAKYMSAMFKGSKFTGDISAWDTSQARIMCEMFSGAKFNGEISSWNVSKVEDMRWMFYISEFNGDISGWDVSKVTEMKMLFRESKFKGDLSDWKPYNLEITDRCFMFDLCEAPVPYWMKIANKETREIAIDNYWLGKKLSQELEVKNHSSKKIKI